MSFSTLREGNLPSSGSSSQTGPHDSDVQPWDVLNGRSTEYQPQRFSFGGRFGVVAERKDMKTKKIMAIKILKRRAAGSPEPDRELATLRRIRSLNPDNIARFFEGFEHNRHTCLVFEMLEKNLHELLRERRGNPESAAGGSDDTTSADEALSESVRAESNVAGQKEEDSASSSSSVECFSVVYINGGDSDAGSSYDDAKYEIHEIGSADDDVAAATSASTEASIAPVTSDLYGAVSPDKHPVTAFSTDEETESDSDSEASVYSLSGGDGVSASSSRNTQRNLGRKRRRFFCRMFSGLCSCCCCADVVE